MPELKTNSEANTTYFMEMGRLMQAFFLQKRFQLAAQKPELVILEVSRDDTFSKCIDISFL